MSRLLSALKQIETKHPQKQPAMEPVSAEELASFGLNRPATPWEQALAGEGPARVFEAPQAAVAEPLQVEEPRLEPPRSEPPRVEPPQVEQAEIKQPETEPHELEQPRSVQPAPPASDAEYRELAETILAGYRPGNSMALMFAGPRILDGTTNALITLGSVLADRVAGDVILVDGNFTQPALARVLGLSGQVGLSDVLQETADWREAVATTPIPHLSVLPGGNPPAEKNWSPNPLRFLRLLNELRSRYCLVLLDGPSLACPFADALAKYCEGVYLWVQLGRTGRNTLRHWLQRLEDSGIPVLGCIAVRK